MSTIKEYLSELSGRRVTVIGMGVSNIRSLKCSCGPGWRSLSGTARPGSGWPSRPRSWRAWGHG